MLSFFFEEVAFPSLDFALNSCHLFLLFSSSFLALIFFGLGGLTSPSCAASFFASGYTVAPAEVTSPGTGGVAGAEVAVVPSAFRLFEIGRISRDLRVSVLSYVLNLTV